VALKCCVAGVSDMRNLYNRCISFLLVYNLVLGLALQDIRGLMEQGLEINY